MEKNQALEITLQLVEERQTVFKQARKSWENIEKNGGANSFIQLSRVNSVQNWATKNLYGHVSVPSCHEMSYRMLKTLISETRQYLNDLERYNSMVYWGILQRLLWWLAEKRPLHLNCFLPPVESFPRIRFTEPDKFLWHLTKEEVSKILICCGELTGISPEPHSLIKEKKNLYTICNYLIDKEYYSLSDFTFITENKNIPSKDKVVEYLVDQHGALLKKALLNAMDQELSTAKYGGKTPIDLQPKFSHYAPMISEAWKIFDDMLLSKEMWPDPKVQKRLHAVLRVCS